MPYNRVYLAGPDVFYPDAAERAARLKEMCHKNGLEGVFPLDSGVKLLVEIGFGRALDLHVVGYTDSKTEYKTRVQDDGLLIENFGMVDNLMVHAAVCGDIFEQAEEAIDYLGHLFGEGEPTQPIDRRSFASLLLVTDT
jgi:nucleoside 2-deoxyribosyltransferase